MVVAINGSVVAPYLANFNLRLAGLAVVIITLASTGYLLSYCISILLGWTEADQVAIIFNGGMRNISAGAVLAVSYFPAPVAVPVVLGMVFQQMLASWSASCSVDVPGSESTSTQIPPPDLLRM